MTKNQGSKREVPAAKEATALGGWQRAPELISSLPGALW